MRELYTESLDRVGSLAQFDRLFLHRPALHQPVELIGCALGTSPAPGSRRRAFQARRRLDIHLGLLDLLLLRNLDERFDQRLKLLNLGELLQVFL